MTKPRLIILVRHGQSEGNNRSRSPSETYARRLEPSPRCRTSSPKPPPSRRYLTVLYLSIPPHT
ncbi:hypothetical protein LB505_005473 [Fusarium chuoi]|nr:hypothetical protein LB505_005473 [Fusarium chuoi]